MSIHLITETALRSAGWTLNPQRGFVSPGQGASLRVRLTAMGDWSAHGWNEVTDAVVWSGVSSMEHLAELVSTLRAAKTVRLMGGAA